MAISGNSEGTVVPLPADAKFIHFPRSDGDPSKRPANVDPSPDRDGFVNFMRPIPLDEVTAVDWRSKIGAAVAHHLNRPGDPRSYFVDDFPQFYQLYDHTKGPVGKARHDPYLFGSMRVLRFRSPAEFIPHAIWLIEDETMDPVNCKCKYCSKTKGQREVNNRVAFLAEGMPISRTNFVRRVRPPITPPLKPTEMVSKERNADLRRRQRYRIGELVWCHLDSPIQGTKKEETINFWPGIIQEVRVKTLVQPHAYGEPYAVTQTDAYKIKLLAVHYSPILPTEEILPYQAYLPTQELLDCIRNSPIPNKLNVDQIPSFVPFHVSPTSEGPQLRRCFTHAVPAFSLAIQTGAHLVRYWTPTNRWIFVPAPGTDSINKPENRYQGLWWGAERIWMDELVRIKWKYQYLAAHGANLYPPTVGAQSRALLLLLRSIFVAAHIESDQGEPQIKRMCRCAGQLYEIADVNWNQNPANAAAIDASLSDSPPSRPSFSPSILLSSPAPGVSSKKSLDSPELYPMAPPPEGYTWRSILPPGHEIVLDISSISGRYYPDLLLEDLIPLEEAETESDGITLGFLASLSGLAPGHSNVMGCVVWEKSRLEMVTTSDKLSREELSEHWDGAFDAPPQPPSTPRRIFKH